MVQERNAPAFMGLGKSGDCGKLHVGSGSECVVLHAVNEIFYFINIRQAEEQKAPRRESVTAGAPRFLVIGLYAFGKVEVKNEAYVGFMYTHAEGNGGHHNFHIVPAELFLVPAPFVIVKARMVGEGRKPVPVEEPAEFVNLLP